METKNQKLLVENKELKHLLSKFKPVFGNDKHRRVVERLHLIQVENQKIIQRKTYAKNGRGKGRVVERVDYMEKQLIETLKEIVDKD